MLLLLQRFTSLSLSYPTGGAIFLLGTLLTLGFAPFFLWPISILSLSGLLFFMRHASSFKQAFFVGFLFGIGHYLTSLYWIPRAFYIDAGGQWGPAIWAGVPALCLITVIFSCFTGCITGTAYKAPKKWRTATFIFLWLLFELARNFPPIHFPWNPIGSIFAGNLIMMQLASVGSVFLLSFFALLAASFLRLNYTSLVSLLLLLAGQAGFGYYRLYQSDTSFTPLTKVRLVQANIETAHKWDDVKRREFLHRHVDLMQTNDPEVKHIIWPETAVAYEVDSDTSLRQMLARHLSPYQKLTLGFLRFDFDQKKGQKAFNSISTINYRAHLSPIYDKRILVPFGETLPFSSITQRFLRTLSFNRATYTSGTAPPVLDLEENLQALPLICYETSFPFYVARHLENQQFLLNITNDNWFDGTTAPYQHFALARLRAVETGLPLVRIANTGISAVVNGYGHIVEKLPPQKIIAKNIHIPQAISPTAWIRISLFFKEYLKKI
ncbi:MAG: apolipoprotein N-acyltransferase [Alphaproteobacteria bacterium]|nr:apolipoprotein N-acyltransferase [Alphaproteobacteria bacterium]MDD9919584.1 apolipoprotein N-acyltransferase [Alphaproteobacteria bacterium]